MARLVMSDMLPIGVPTWIESENIPNIFKINKLVISFELTTYRPVGRRSVVDLVIDFSVFAVLRFVTFFLVVVVDFANNIFNITFVYL